MSPALFVIIADANFPAIDAVDGALGTQKIQNAVSMGGFTYYVTSNLVPPGGTVYLARLNANGSFIVSQSKQPALTTRHTFMGWTIPA
jgi:hypothetical protein